MLEASSGESTSQRARRAPHSEVAGIDGQQDVSRGALPFGLEALEELARAP